MNLFVKSFLKPGQLVFSLLLIFSTQIAFTQTPKPEKLSGYLKVNAPIKNLFTKSTYLVVAKDSISFMLFLKTNNIPAQNLKHYNSTGIFSIDLTWQEIKSHFLPSEIIYFIDEKRKPVEELRVNGFDLSVNKISRVHSLYPQLNGSGMVVSIKEQSPDTLDIDFKNRFVATSLQSTSSTTHATLMTSMIAGGGNSFYTAKGVAWGSKITSSAFSSLLPDPDAYYQQHDISIQNHSYGTGIENYYGADAMAYDISTIRNPGLLHVFSAGNSGASASTIGSYQGIDGNANITGSFKMAKNILTVGAIDAINQIPLQSSRGPAHDGRIKPDLIAFGTDGSSGSAAIVSGIALILQQAYKSLHHDSLPSSDLIKAILLNSADDAGPPNPDYIAGYGNANASNAIKTILIEHFLAGKLSTGETVNFSLQVPAGIKQLKLTLVWNDVPAQANAVKALINNLDLELISTTQSWQPWVLNHFPHKDSLQLPAIRKKDSLNNVEQITVDFPDAGTYSVNVNGFKINSSAQTFSIAYQFDSVDYFEWHYPVYQQNIFPGENNIIRWENSFENNSGKLEYSLNGSEWHLVDANVDLTKGYYQWLAPDTFSNARLRMQIDNKPFESDSFTISPVMDLLVGFHCQDSILLYWKNLKDANGYRLYNLTGSYLEPVGFTNDTFIVISKAVHASQYFAVAPIAASIPAIKSYTINYTLQGVDCYFRSLIAGIVNNDIHLQLSLGSLYNINLIEWEILTLNGYKLLHNESAVNQTILNFIDVGPASGVNTYRVKITLNNGQFIYSESVTIYFVDVNNYRVYPNPANQLQPINIIAREADIAIMQVYNSAGIIMLEKRLDDVINTIPAGILSKGFYMIRIINDDGVSSTLKLVVQ